MMNDDLQNELLDNEFRQILYVIKPYINHVNDHYHLERYRVWLERLNGAHPSEKLERNKYLIELANQIRLNTLQAPFMHNPPKGLLPNLRTAQNVSPKGPDPVQISEQIFLDDIQWPYLSPKRSPPPKETSPPKKKSLKPRPSPFQKLGSSEQVDSPDSSSWCDLTDTNSATQTCADTDGDDSNEGVSSGHRDQALKTKEHFVKKYMESKKSSSKASFNAKEFLAEEDKNRKPTHEEVEALKMRMKDLIEVKNALKDTQCLTEDRKKTVEVLQEKLIQAEQQNAQLKTLLERQQRKFMELDKIKSKELTDFQDKYTLLRQKEAEYLKQFQRNELFNLEKTHSGKIAEMQAQIDSLKNEYEEKIKKMTDSHLNLIEEKESEIKQLQSKMQAQESQISSLHEGNGEQIYSLKRCISRLDRAMRKSEKEYMKKVEKLTQDLEIKEMSSHVQLQTQRADLIARHSATKQEELKSALNSLEGKYKKMMETMQLHALEAKKHDDRLIEQLKLLLHKHNIPYSF